MTSIPVQPVYWHAKIRLEKLLQEYAVFQVLSVLVKHTENMMISYPYMDCYTGII